MDIAVLIYDGFTALDAVGPAQVLAMLPGARMRWVAAEAGAKRSDAGVSMVAEHTLGDVARPDVILVPGALDVRPASTDPRVLDWLRAAHATSQWTTSVCTGALVLGAAGLLHGLEATTHWAALEQLGTCGARPVQARMVRQGKIITAAGVSAGIDMALRLTQLIAGDRAAQIVQLGIEYDPDPPFAGSVTKASPEIVAAARRALTRPVPKEAP